MASEKVSIELIIEVAKSSKNLKDIERNLGFLNSALDAVEDGSDSFKKLSSQIEDSEKAFTKLLITSDKTKLTFGELELAQKNLLKQLKETDRGSEQFRVLQQEIVKVNKEIGNTELGLVGLHREDEFDFFAGLTGAVGSLTSSFILLGGEGNETMEEIGQNIEKAIGISELFNGAIEGIAAGTKLWNNYKGAVLESNIVTKAATFAQGAWNKVQALFGKGVDVSSKSLKGFKTALIATGIGAIVVLIGALVANWDKLSAAMSYSTAAQQKNNEVRKKAIESIGAELSASDKLSKILEDETITREDKVKAVKKLQEEYPSLLSNVDAENTSIKDINKALKLNTELLNLNAQAKAIADLRTEQYTKQVQAEVDAQTGANEGLFNSYQAYLVGTTGKDLAIKKSRAAQAETYKEIKALDDLDKKLQKQIKSIEKKGAVVGTTGGDAEKKAAEAEKKARAAESRARAGSDASRNRAEKAKQQAEKDAEDERKRLEDLEAFKEELFQKTLKDDDELATRRISLELEANLKRAEALIRDEGELAIALKAIRDDAFSQMEEIENNSIKIEKEKLLVIANLNRQANDNLNILEQEQALVDAELIEDEIEREKKKNEILEKLNTARINQIQTNSEIQLQNTDLTESQRLEIIKNTELEISKIKQEQRDINLEKDKEALDKRKEIEEQIVDAVFQAVQQIADAAFQFAQDARDSQLESSLERLQEQYSKESQLLNDQVTNGVLTQRDADAELIKLQKKQQKEEDRLKKEAFEKNKTAGIGQALINGAIAVTQAFAQLGPVAGAIASILIGLTTGIQIATIENQKYARGGILQGPSHSGGGISTPYGELEGGEAVINKTSTQMFKKELSMINQVGGGVAFARGGVLPTGSVSSNQDANLQLVIERLNQTLSKPIRSFIPETELRGASKRSGQLQNNAQL